ILPEGEAGQCKLVDFGIAVASGDPSGSAEIVGTPAYMSPEQCRGDVLDPRSDVFSLGCVLYEALTGRRAYDCAHAYAGMAKLLFGEPPRASEHNPEVREALDTALRTMLAHERGSRPANGRAAADLLRRFLGLAPGTGARGSLTRRERRLAAVVIATG